MNGENRMDKIYGGMLGLAFGDAVGFPAMFHRTIPLGWSRGILWDFNKQADESKVNKFSLPFTLGQSEDHLYLCGTDDTEYAVIAASILLEIDGEPTLDALFQGWKRHVVEYSGKVWGGVSERASIDNTAKGLEAPATGNDNPHHFDDGAVARAVPVGLRYAGRPSDAAAVAGRLASITNAEDGVFAAQAMAASIAAAVGGATPGEIVEAGMAYIPQDSWLGRKTRQAQQILKSAGSGFAALPGWNHQIVNGIYNYGNIAPETLAVAYAVFQAADGKLQDCIQLASLVPKQADSMPAMVGALSGALQGASVIPETWVAVLDTVKGICVPHLKGTSLRQIAKRLANG